MSIETRLIDDILATWPAETRKVKDCVKQLQHSIKTKKFSLGSYTVELLDGLCWAAPVK